MRVNYLGNFGPEWSTENDIRKAFEHLGWEVVCSQEDATSWQQLRESALASDLVLFTSSWDDAQPLFETINTFRICALKGIPTATVHLDVFFGSDRGDRNWLMNPMFFTRYVFTASGDYQQEWDKLGVNHIWLPPAVRHDAVHPGNFREEYACDLAFAGSGGVGYHSSVWPYRQELVEHLRIIAQRNGWKFRNPGGELESYDAGKIQRGEDMNDFYRSAKVTVGDSLCLQHEKSQYSSDRPFECCGRFGFVIMPKINYLCDIFGDSMPVYDWGNWDQLESIIKFYLANEKERESRRQKAFEIVRDGHTYVDRVKKIIETVGIHES